MKKRLLNFIKKPFVRNVLILSTGTAGAQLIAIIFTPLITRMFGPEAYGLMGTFSAIISTLAPIVALTYPIAIVLPQSKQEALGIVKLSLKIISVITIFMLITIIIFYDYIILYLNLTSLSYYIYFIPVAIFLTGLLQIMNQWLIRTKSFSIKAKATLLQALVSNGGKAGVGFFYPTALTLIIFSTLQAGLNAWIIFSLYKVSFKNIIYSIRYANTKELANKYRDFPLLRSPETFIFAVTQSLPVIMLTSFFGPAAAGFYAISRTVLQVPSTLIGRSVGDVFYPRISEAAYNKEKTTPLIKKATYMLGVAGFLPYLLIFILGPWLFSFLFGEEWYVAGEYARWMAFGLFFGFLKNPSIKAYPALSSQGFHLVFSIIILMIRTSSFVLGYFIFNDDVIAVALFGISGGLLNLLQILITFRISKKFDATNIS